MTINATLAASPRPKTMNRIGSSAIGGMTAMVVTSGPKVARTEGIKPSTSPTSSADTVEIASPMPSRHRLAPVSAQNNKVPVIGSGTATRLCIAATIAAGVGKILSAGLMAWRLAEAMR